MASAMREIKMTSLAMRENKYICLFAILAVHKINYINLFYMPPVGWWRNGENDEESICE